MKLSYASTFDKLKKNTLPITWENRKCEASLTGEHRLLAGTPNPSVLFILTIHRANYDNEASQIT